MNISKNLVSEKLLVSLLMGSILVLLRLMKNGQRQNSLLLHLDRVFKSISYRWQLPILYLQMVVSTCNHISFKKENILMAIRSRHNLFLFVALSVQLHLRKSQPCSLSQHSVDLQKQGEFLGINLLVKRVHRRLRVVNEDMKRAKMVARIPRMLVMAHQMIQNLLSSFVLTDLAAHNMRSSLLQKHFEKFLLFF